MTLYALAQIDDDVDAADSCVPARADTDSWTTVVAYVARLAQEVAGTSFVPEGSATTSPPRPPRSSTDARSDSRP